MTLINYNISIRSLPVSLPSGFYTELNRQVASQLLTPTQVTVTVHEQVRRGTNPDMPGNNVTLLVVDARTHIHTAICQALRSQPLIRLVATAQNYAEAQEQVAQFCPDIIWFKMNIGQADGIAEIRRLKSLSPNSRILALADEEEEQEAFAAIMAGAQGYRFQGAIDPGEITTIVQMLRRDEYLLDPRLLLPLMQRLRATALGESGQASRYSAIQFSADYNKLALLTVREGEIFKSIGQNQSESEIARSLHISQKMVRRHVRSILNKLGL